MSWKTNQTYIEWKLNAKLIQFAYYGIYYLADEPKWKHVVFSMAWVRKCSWKEGGEGSRPGKLYGGGQIGRKLMGSDFRRFCLALNETYVLLAVFFISIWTLMSDWQEQEKKTSLNHFATDFAQFEMIISKF